MRSTMMSEVVKDNLFGIFVYAYHWKTKWQKKYFLFEIKRKKFSVKFVDVTRSRYPIKTTSLYKHTVTFSIEYSQNNIITRTKIFVSVLIKLIKLMKFVQL